MLTILVQIVPILIDLFYRGQKERDEAKKSFFEWIEKKAGESLNSVIAKKELDRQRQELESKDPAIKTKLNLEKDAHLSMVMDAKPNPAWYVLAMSEIGVVETYGSKHTPRILEYHKATSLKATTDEVAWCASFVSWCLEKAGVPSTRSAAARSYLKWGKPLTIPRRGCVVVFKRGNSSWQGHVGFFVEETTDGKIVVLGGNQSNSVRTSRYSKKDLLGYRWPEVESV